MKNEKGVTLAVLIIYVMVFSITIALLASLSNYIYGNLNKISSEEISSEEFNKFNTYFLDDVKNSKTAEVSNSGSSGDITIKLESGAVYTYKKSESAIYKNKEKIARNIAEFTASYDTVNGENGKNKNTIDVTIKTGKDASNPIFQKTIKYVLKYW